MRIEASNSQAIVAPAEGAPAAGPARPRPPVRRLGAGRIFRLGLTLVAVGFLTIFVVVPAANVFYQAFSKGWSAYKEVFFPAPVDRAKVERIQGRLAEIERLPILQKRALFAERRKLREELSDIYGPHERAKKNWSAVRMTLGVAAVVLPLNMLFGIAAAWSVTKFRFRGRSLLVSVIDLPFSVSPVIAGLIFVLLLGAQGTLSAWSKKTGWAWLAPGDWKWPDPTSFYWRGFSAGHWWPIGAREFHVGVIFTPLATVLASVFVTFPFIARSLIPLMESQGPEAEQAALTLGAGGWYTFRRVTLPSIKWGLLYGAILCTARAMGEFGAVSVVSGHLDSNDTMPLRVEKLWQEYRTQAAFTVASLLACLAIVTLAVKSAIEWKTRRDREGNEL